MPDNLLRQDTPQRGAQPQGGRTNLLRGDPAPTQRSAAADAGIDLQSEEEVELYETAQRLRAEGDERGARLAIAELAGMRSARDDDGGIEDALARGEAALGSGAQGIFGLGDQVAAVGGFLANQVRNLVDDEGTPDLSFGEIRAAMRGRRRALAADNPVSSAAGFTTGAVASGGPAARFGGALLSRAGGLGRRARQALTMRGGQPVRNVARSAAGSAAAGGTAAAIESDLDPETTLRGAAAGGIAGPLFGGVIRGFGEVGGAVRRRVSPDRAAQSAMLRRLVATRNANAGPDAPRVTAAEIAEDLQSRAREFQSTTGRAPRLVELLDEDEARELADVVRLGRSGSARMRAAEREAGEARSENIARTIRRGDPDVSATEQTEIRDQVMDRIMGRIADAPVDLTPADARLLTTPEVRQALGSTNFGRLLERIDPDALGDTAVPATGAERVGRLTIRELDDIRQALAARGNAPGFARVFRNLADEVGEIGRRTVPEYGEALDEFAERSTGIEGIRRGRAVTTQGDTEEFIAQLRPDVAARESGLGQRGAFARTAGARAGARTRLAEQAGEGPEAAARTVRDLAESPDLARRVEATLGPEEAARLRRSGAAELRGARSLSLATPRIRTLSQEDSAAVNEAIRGIVLAGGRASGAFQAVAARSLLSYVDGNAARADRLARALTDPDMADAAIGRLRQLGASSEDIRRIYTNATRAAGITAGDVAAGDQRPEGAEQ